MSQNPPLCKLCSEPCAPRLDRPGKFRHLCEEHWHEYKNQKARESYHRHKEVRVQTKRDWNVKHGKAYRETTKVKEYMRAYQPAWQSSHPGKRLEYERRWIAKNREKANAKVKRRSHLKRTAQGFYTEDQLQARIDVYGGYCYLCGEGYEAMDHVIPVSKGGTNWPANLRPICDRCNSRKAAKRLSELDLSTFRRS